MKKSSSVIHLYLLFCFLVYSTWSLITPFDGAPDEKMRWKLVAYIIRHWTLPSGNNLEIFEQPWGFSYAFLPYIPQIISALLFKIIGGEFLPLFPDRSLYLLRLPSVLFSLGTVFFTYKIGQKLFNKKVAWFFVILVSMWPEFSLIASYINNDSFALFTVSIITYAWICCIQTNFDWKSCILLAVGVGLCFLSYYNAFGFILLSIVLWIWFYLFKIKDKKDFKNFLKKTAVMLSIVFIIAGWWYIRNAYLYKGDFLGIRALLETSEKFAIESLKPSNRHTYLNQGKSIVAMLTESLWITDNYKSFIARFGYCYIDVHSSVYYFYTLLIVFGIIGFIVGTFRGIYHSSVFRNLNIFYVLIIISILIPIIISLFYSYARDFQPQGRYCLPMLLSLCILITSGLFNMTKVFSKLKADNVIIVLETLIFFVQAVCIYTVFTYFH